MNKFRKVLNWLMVEMPLNKPFNINDDQRPIIIDIFALSDLNMPVEPNNAYQYYFKIENDYKLITKVKYYE